MHRIGSDLVNPYLVEDASGVMIVDAALPGHWRELDQELRQLGYALDHVRGIVLTHGDTDDIGFAERSQRAPYRGRALRGCESLRAVVREELDPGVA